MHFHVYSPHQQIDILGHGTCNLIVLFANCANVRLFAQFEHN
jgi:hypothetical protein